MDISLIRNVLFIRLDHILLVWSATQTVKGCDLACIVLCYKNEVREYHLYTK